MSPRDVRRHLLLAGVLAAVLCGCSQAPTPPGPSGAPAGVVGRGEGKVAGRPDTLTVTLGVQTQAASAQAALDANNARANAVIALLKSRGVRDEDSRTSDLNISPYYGAEGGRISGYQVSNQVTVTLHDIPAAGGIIDAAAGAAGDAIRVQQVSFSIADDSTLRAQAREAAARQAKEKAEQLARALGVSLGPLLSATETAASPPPMPYGAQASRAAADVPIEPGTQQVTITVEAVYAVG